MWGRKETGGQERTGDRVSSLSLVQPHTHRCLNRLEDTHVQLLLGGLRGPIGDRETRRVVKRVLQDDAVVDPAEEDVDPKNR